MLREIDVIFVHCIYDQSRGDNIYPDIIFQFQRSCFDKTVNSSPYLHRLLTPQDDQPVCL